MKAVGGSQRYPLAEARAAGGNLERQTRIALTNYQRDILTDERQIVVTEKSRRTGVSWMESLRAMLTRASLGARGIREHYHYLAQDKKVTAVFRHYCWEWGEVINEFWRAECEEAGDEYFPLVDFDKASIDKLPFWNGSTIYFHSSSAAGVRGRTGSVTIDEAAHHEDLQKTWEAIYPILMTPGQASKLKLRVISTHLGAGNYFNTLVKKAKTLGAKPGSDWGHVRIDIYKALDEGLAYKIPGNHLQYKHAGPKRVNEIFLRKLREDAGPRAFQEEFEARPAAVGSAIVSQYDYDAVATLVNVPESLDHSRTYGPLSIGIDIGRSRDKTCIIAVEERYDAATKIHHQVAVAIRILSNWQTDKQKILFAEWLKHKNVAAAHMDAGIFTHVYEYLDELGLPITAFTLNASKKAELAGLINKYVVHKTIALPSDNEKFREDILAVEAGKTGTGLPSLDGRTADGHADCFWALGLALDAAEQGDRPFIA